jgi:DNA-directed RNA polymerase subunit RPC12/RpoP
MIEGYEHLSFVINQLVDKGLEDKEIATVFNIYPYLIKKLRKSKRVTIDKERFIRMWKNNVPYEVIAKVLNIKFSTVCTFKSRYCRGVIRMQICSDCGTAFETTRTNREVCESCKFEHRVMYFNKKAWIEKVHKGTILLEERREKGLEDEELELLRKLRRKDRQESQKEWWEEK